jgi:hypothetical protein
MRETQPVTGPSSADDDLVSQYVRITESVMWSTHYKLVWQCVVQILGEDRGAEMPQCGLYIARNRQDDRRERGGLFPLSLEEVESVSAGLQLETMWQPTPDTPLRSVRHDGFAHNQNVALCEVVCVPLHMTN